MEEKKKEKLFNYLIVISFLVILICAIFLTWYYFDSRNNKCVSNPLTYGAKQLEEKFGYKFIGHGSFISPIMIKTPTVTFNSTSVSIN